MSQRAAAEVVAERLADPGTELAWLRSMATPEQRRAWRVLPTAQVDPLRAWIGGRRLALFLDFDGTLTPIVDDPRAAWLDPGTRAELAALAAQVPVAVLSGRDRVDLEARVGLPELIYAGCHGFDIRVPAAIHGAARAYQVPAAELARPRLAEAEARLGAALGDLPGVVLERKRYGLAVHYRQVRGEAERARVRACVDEVAAATELRQRAGKQVRELVPAIAWDKGRALAWIVEALGLADHALVYIGDDETDEDAFAQLAARGDGVGVRVGASSSRTLADYALPDPPAVLQLLRRLVEPDRSS